MICLEEGCTNAILPLTKNPKVADGGRKDGGGDGGEYKVEAIQETIMSGPKSRFTEDLLNGQDEQANRGFYSTYLNNRLWTSSTRHKQLEFRQTSLPEMV